MLQECVLGGEGNHVKYVILIHFYWYLAAFGMILLAYLRIPEEQIHSQTEVIGVFCRSAGADQNSEQALRALLGGLRAWLYGPRVGCLKCAPTPLHN